MSTTKFAVVIFICICSTAALADPKIEPAAVLAQYAKAVTNHDMKTIRTLWATDDAVSLYDSGNVYSGWRDVSLSYLTARLGELDHINYEVSDAISHKSEHLAWVTFKYKFSGHQPGQESLESEGVGTAILTREKDAWKLVHIQQSNYPNKLKQVIIQQQ
jgi:ketosteroid isomerase-like protein